MKRPTHDEPDDHPESTSTPTTTSQETLRTEETTTTTISSKSHKVHTRSNKIPQIVGNSSTLSQRPPVKLIYPSPLPESGAISNVTYSAPSTTTSIEEGQQNQQQSTLVVPGASAHHGNGEGSMRTDRDHVSLWDNLVTGSSREEGDLIFNNNEPIVPEPPVMVAEVVTVLDARDQQQLENARMEIAALQARLRMQESGQQNDSTIVHAVRVVGNANNSILNHVQYQTDGHGMEAVTETDEPKADNKRFWMSFVIAFVVLIVGGGFASIYFGVLRPSSSESNQIGTNNPTGFPTRLQTTTSSSPSPTAITTPTTDDDFPESENGMFPTSSMSPTDTVAPTSVVSSNVPTSSSTTTAETPVFVSSPFPTTGQVPSSPTSDPSTSPESRPTGVPSPEPASQPSAAPVPAPTQTPTKSPSRVPTAAPARNPTKQPTQAPVPAPTSKPTAGPTRRPTSAPSRHPTRNPTRSPTSHPTIHPTSSPTASPTETPTKNPTESPTHRTTRAPTKLPTAQPTPLTRRGYWLKTLLPTLDSTAFGTTAEWDAYLVQNPNSPQAKAVVWLSEEDEYTSSPEEFPTNELLERYAVVVLYYATSGESWVTLSDYYLDTKSSICEWNEGYQGVHCHDSSANPLYPTLIALVMLWGCSLEGRFPSEITLLREVYWIHFENNSLSGTLPKDFPSSVRTLRFDRNMMTGTLPREWGKSLQNLEYLDLSLNSFRGTIPSEWGNLQALTYLHVAGTDVTGTIPTTLGLLTQLGLLGLESNNLSGTLPSELGNLESLTDLWLIYNGHLSGTVPDEFANLKHLVECFLSHTALSGSLESVFCDNSPPLWISADCLGDDPEIECSCCYDCCSASAGCTYM